MHRSPGVRCRGDTIVRVEDPRVHHAVEGVAEQFVSGQARVARARFSVLRRSGMVAGTDGLASAKRPLSIRGARLWRTVLARRGRSECSRARPHRAARHLQPRRQWVQQCASSTSIERASADRALSATAWTRSGSALKCR